MKPVVISKDFSSLPVRWNIKNDCPKNKSTTTIQVRINIQHEIARVVMLIVHTPYRKWFIQNHIQCMPPLFKATNQIWNQSIHLKPRFLWWKFSLLFHIMKKCLSLMKQKLILKSTQNCLYHLHCVPCIYI